MTPTPASAAAPTLFPTWDPNALALICLQPPGPQSHGWVQPLGERDREIQAKDVMYKGKKGELESPDPAGLEYGQQLPAL